MSSPTRRPAPVSKFQIVDFDKKIKFLCDELRTSFSALQDAWWKEVKLDKRMTAGWENNPSPRMFFKSRVKFVDYWKKDGIPFPDVYFTMSSADFEIDPELLNALKKRKGPVSRALSEGDIADVDLSDARGLSGTYQVIRPHSHLPDTYILEPFRIVIQGSSVTNLMYSYNRRKREFLYSGEGHYSRRYYFSLLDRKHEFPGPGAENSFRSVVFYIGPGKSSFYLSGIMLRGVSGSSDGSTQAVGIPLIAIKMQEDVNFEKPDFTAATNGKHQVYKVNNGSHVITGEISKKKFPVLFRYSHALFSALRSVKNGLFHSGGIVLHTIVSGHLDDMDTDNKINYAGWVEAVESSSIIVGSQ